MDGKETMRKFDDPYPSYIYQGVGGMGKSRYLMPCSTAEYDTRWSPGIHARHGREGRVSSDARIRLATITGGARRRR